jgi:hypothetical protein
MEPDVQHQTDGAALLTGALCLDAKQRHYKQLGSIVTHSLLCPAMSLWCADEPPAAPAYEQQPKAKRRISRLQHMSVHRAAESPGKDQELSHKASPAAKAGFSLPASLARDEDMEDQADDDVQGGASPTALQSQKQQQQQHEQLEEPSFSPAKSSRLCSVLQPAAQPARGPANDDALMAEAPAVSAAVAASQPENTAAAEALDAAVEAEAAAPVEAAAATKQQQQPVRLQDINLDDDDDDDWEDQPAPYISPAEDSAVHGSLEAAAGDTAAEQSDVPAHDPTSRRRAQYDDEDEWEELLAQEKKATQAGRAACGQ